MKQLEISTEKAQESDEKLKKKIHHMMKRLKFNGLNTTKLNLGTNDIENKIYHEKVKMKKVSDELNDTFTLSHIQNTPKYISY